MNLFGHICDRYPIHISCSIGFYCILDFIYIIRANSYKKIFMQYLNNKAADMMSHCTHSVKLAP